MKFCKDCKWEGGGTDIYTCIHPAIARAGERSIVTGKIPFEPQHCDKIREDESKCGLEGRLWAPNRRTKLKEWLK